MKNRGSAVTLTHQAVIIFISLIVGICIFLFVNFAVLPHSLSIPKTTAVNWLVIHRHSLTLDYIRFGLFVLIIQTAMITGWLFFVWKRKK